MQKPYTLIIPSWYPTGKQPLNGLFIKRHAELISTFQNVVVMYVIGAETYSIDEKKTSNSFVEYTTYYAESSSRAFNQLKYIWYQIKAYRCLTRKFGRPAIIHLNVIFPAGIFVYLLLLFRHTPLIITEHWTGYMEEDGRYAKLPSIAKRITKSLLAKAKKVSLVSDYFKQLMLKLKLVEAEKLVTVYNLLNMPATEYIQTESKTMKALFVGNLVDAHKNISVLINAVELVVHKFPAFQLTIVGGGSEMEKFVKLAEGKRLLNKNIFFKGYVDNDKLTPVYQEHGFFILTSNYETFNIAAAEAMLSGLPVVSSHCGGPTEFVNEHTGIWIDKTTAEGTAAAIMQMIERRKEFDSQRIARETQDKFSDRTILTQLKALYSAVTD